MLPRVDIDGDGTPGSMQDFYLMSASWLLRIENAGFDARADLNHDGVVNNIDADILSGNWKVIHQQSGRFYFHFDGLGSVAAVSGRDGRTVEVYRYDVFGRTAIYDGAGRQQRPVSAVGNPYFFTGRRLDFETGLYYYRARMYSPSLGRFMQTDPIGYGDGINWYAYCGNNPIILTDPLGLLPGLTINPGGADAIAQTYDSTMRWLYTGDWNASDSVYNGAREAAAGWLYDTSPVRGAFVSVGKGDIVGASVTGSWTMDSGYGITGVVRTRVGNKNGRLGYERGVSWSQENGFSDTGRVSVTSQNVHGKLTRDGNLRLGINYGVGSGGFVIDPSKFGGLINEWKDMLGFGNADGGVTPSSGYYNDFSAGGTNNCMK